MKNKISFVLILILLFSFSSKALASEICLPGGYTVLTINGVFTNEVDAIKNKDKLKSKLSIVYNSEPLIVDYLYNPSHGKIIDGLDALGQKYIDSLNTINKSLFNERMFSFEDADFANMLADASEKITTQKLLLVGHSQGNFYANSFYENVVDRPGGVPKQSIGVYGVASPASYVAGGGKYITSDTDAVIASFVGKIINILPPNIHIPLQEGDGNGHSFSNVYLKYEAPRIISEIKYSLSRLENNDEQEPDSPCISPPELSYSHKFWSGVLDIADPTANLVKDGLSGAYDFGKYIADSAHNTGMSIGEALNNLFANVIESLPEDDDVATTSEGEESEKTESLADQEQTEENVEEITEENNLPKDETKDETKEETETEESISEPNTEENKTEDNSETDSENPDDTSDTVHHSGGGGGDDNKDEIVPVITILGDNPVNIYKGSTYTDAGATALDDVDGVREVSTVGVAEVDTSLIGTYIVTYTAEDLSGNVGTSTRTVNVIATPLATTIIDENTTLPAGKYNYDNLVITNNAVLTLEGDPDSTDSFKGVEINAVNITIDAGATISADGKGYLRSGPGAPIDDEGYAGASYGGIGYRNISSPTYGSAREPLDLGSGGIAHYFRGGGAIKLVVSDTITNNGVVSSGGDNTSSGGSIYVTAKEISGSGVFNANGGAVYSSSIIVGPGGGGRIAIYYEEFSFNGKAEALGGCGSYDGYSRTCADSGTVGFFDTALNNLLVNTSWRFQKNDSPLDFNKIVLTDGATVGTEEGADIKAKDLLIDKISKLTLSKNQTIDISSISIKDNSTLTFSGEETITADTISLIDGSMITVAPEKILYLSVPNINIDDNSLISASEKGYVEGPGTPTTSDGNAGASHGGIGERNTSALTYGNAEEPIDFGSGGRSPHPKGGGAIRLDITDTLQNDGTISADGNVSSSGGSVYITVKSITGNGKISANGGGLYVGGYFAGSGGGGRVAVYYKESSFSGEALALGGCGSYDGYSKVCAGDGTVKMIDESILPPPPVLSGDKKILTFNFSTLVPEVVGIVDETNHTISLTVPFGTDVTNLVPTITISDKASISPNSEVAQDFSNPITYKVTAEDSSTEDYIVTVIIAPEPDPDPSTTVPEVTHYMLNGVEESIIANPSTENPVVLNFVANKNVDWVSIKIEKENSGDVNVYKYYYPGDDCDGENTCTENWDGELTGELLQDGSTYKIKVKIRDLVDGTDYEFFSPYIITVNTSI